MKDEERQPDSQEQEPASDGISRREFFKDAGLVIGGAAAGAVLGYVAGPTKEVTKEVVKEVPAAAQAVATAVPQPVKPATGMVEPYLEPETTAIQTYCHIIAVDTKKRQDRPDAPRSL